MDIRDFSEINRELYMDTFPYAVYSITVTIAIILFHGIFGSMLDFWLGDRMAFELNPLSMIISQLFLLLLPAFIASKPVPMNKKEIFRLNFRISPFILILSIIGLIGFQFFVTGFLSVQESIIPKAFYQFYQHFSSTYETMLIHFVGSNNYLLLLRAILIIAVLPAICEEFLFRGFLQKSLEKTFKPVNAILITSIIFGLSHLNPIDTIPLICIGIFFGIIAYNTNSLILPIILHFLNNCYSVVEIYFRKSNNIINATSKTSILISLFFTIFGFIVLYSINILIAKRFMRNKTEF